MVKKVGDTLDKTMLSRVFSFAADFLRGFSMLRSIGNFRGRQRVQYVYLLLNIGSSLLENLLGLILYRIHFGAYSIKISERE